MSEILSQDEVNALLKGVEEGEIPAGPPGGAATTPRAGVRGLDLTSQERSLRGQLPGLELVVDRLVRSLRGSLGSFFGQIPDVRVSALEVEKFASLMARLRQPVSMQLFKLSPLRGQGMLVVTPPLVAALLQAMFGGSPARKTSVAGREFSAIEQRILEKLGAQVLRDLQEAWRPVEPVECLFIRSETNPLFVTLAGPQDLVLRLDLRVEVSGCDDGFISLCIPNAALDPIRPRLRRLQGNVDEQDGPPDTAWHERLRAALAEAECEVAAELGTHRMSLRDVVRLQVGDVIPLRTGREGPVLMRVEGRPCFIGAPGVSGGSNAVRVTARV